MKILLVGEYSRLHNSLKEGLIALGHEVKILGFNDGFKDYPVDYQLQLDWENGWKKKLRVGLYKLTGFDLRSFATYRQFFKQKHQFTGYDVVQLINENSFYCNYRYEKKILSYLFANNKKAFLLSCGSDYINTQYSFAHPKIKSVIQPYLDGKVVANDFTNVLKFRQPSYKKLHDYMYRNVRGVIASDIDYVAPLRQHPKYIGLIPNPINWEKLQWQPLDVTDKIIIFHGINTENYYKKGSDYFEKALQIIGERYAGEVEIKVTRSLPYNEYIKVYDECHILLDQVYAFDQGYNALEAMAKGKCVFTGAEAEFEAHYGLSERVAVNVRPDVARIVKDLSYLIENRDAIAAIGRNARQFIEREHDYKVIAAQYVAAWESI